MDFFRPLNCCILSCRGGAPPAQMGVLDTLRDCRGYIIYHLTSIPQH